MSRLRSLLLPALVLTLPMLSALPMAPTRAAERLDPRVGHGNDGLVSARTVHVPHCPASAKVAKESGTCTHGADAAPVGVDVTEPRTVAELRDQAYDGSPPTTVAAVPGTTVPSTDGSGEVVCDGDGVSGKRVQVLYVRTNNVASRFAALRDTLEQNVLYTDGELNASAADTGGARHFRFVTVPDGTGGCTLDLREVVLPAPPAGTSFGFGYSVQKLQEAGYKADGRRYLMLTDADVLCGVASMYGDDSQAQTNANNGTGPLYARADTGCWHYAEAHELMHNLGGVQNSAPHSSGAGHCWDGSDIMCYDDGGPYYRGSDGVSGTADDRSWQRICPVAGDERYDCGKDDYFNTAPVAGSYLATHWNTAFSAYLIQPQVTASNTIQVATPADQSSGHGSPVAPLTLSATDTTAGQTLTWTAAGLPAGLTVDPSSGVVSGTPSASGPATVVVTAYDGTGAAGSARFTWTISPVAPAAPTGLAVTPGRKQLSLSWSAPADDGGSPITSYVVTVTPQGGAPTTTSTASPATTFVATGLTNGTPYDVSVAATTAVGTGAASAASGTPQAVAPGAPTSLVATPANGSATVAFAPPADDGDSPVTAYTLHASTGEQVSGTSSPLRLTGLSNGVSRTFTVTATNTAGTGTASAPSAPVTYWPMTLTMAVPTGWYAKAETVSGRLGTSTGAAVPGARVALSYHRSDESSTTWHPVTTVTTTSTGSWSYATTTRYTGTWRATYSGDAVHAAATRLVGGQARAWFSAYPASTSRARNTTVTWSARTAAPYRTVTLQVYSSGAWKTVASRTGDRYGHVAFSIRAVYGTRSFRLVQPGNKLLLGYTGATRTVRGT